MNNQPCPVRKADEPKRVVVVGPPGRAQAVIVQELLDLGYGVICAPSIEAALAFVETGLMDGMVVQLSRFRTAALKRLARGLLLHPEVSLIGAMSVFSSESPISRWAIRWAGFASPKQLSRGLSSS